MQNRTRHLKKNQGIKKQYKKKKRTDILNLKHSSAFFEIMIYIIWVHKRVTRYAWCNAGILGILPKGYKQLVPLGEKS